MESKFIEGTEIIEKYNITEHNLAELINSNQLKALDFNTDEPIDWEKHKKQFQYFQKAADSKITVPEIRALQLDWRSEQMVTETDDQEHDLLVEVTNHDCEGNKIDRIPWKILYRWLKADRYEIEIPLRQYKEILDGWGINQIASRAKEAKFRKSELKKLINNPTDKRAETKKINNLHRIIGALLVTKFPPRRSSCYWKNDRKPEKSAMMRKIHDELLDLEFKLDGMKGIRRNVIPEAIEQIMKNKN